MNRLLITCSLLATLAAGCGTNTGNPGATSTVPTSGNPALISASASLASGVCTAVANCNKSAVESNCLSQVMGLTSYTSQLGTKASAYPTLNALQSAEYSAIVTANYSNLNACLNAIGVVPCGSALMGQSYSASVPGSYSQTNLLFQAAAACDAVF